MALFFFFFFFKFSFLNIDLHEISIHVETKGTIENALYVILFVALDNLQESPQLVHADCRAMEDAEQQLASRTLQRQASGSRSTEQRRSITSIFTSKNSRRPKTPSVIVTDETTTLVRSVDILNKNQINRNM